jgi:hypothetical protein
VSVRVFVLLVCTGCFIGGGPVVGYGTKRGFYAGGAGGVGVNVAGGTFEIGGTNKGILTQLRLDLDVTKARFTHWHNTAGSFYPGARGSLGIAWTEGGHDFVGGLGADIGELRGTNYCAGATILYAGIEWRYIAHESQFVFAPRAERLSDICLR